MLATYRFFSWTGNVAWWRKSWVPFPAPQNKLKNFKAFI
jgi:hypothetical protein